MPEHQSQGTATEAMQLITVKFRSANTKDAKSKGAPIIGMGTLQPHTEGLRVQARRTRKALNTILSVIIGLVTLFFGVALIDQLDLLESFQDARKFEMAAGLVLGLVPGMVSYSLLSRFVRGPQVHLLVPWTELLVLSAETDKITLRLGSPELRGDVTAVAADPTSAHAMRTFTAQWQQNTPQS
jgi:hypothetical protein